MTRYAISLPDNIPSDYFARVDGVNDAIKKSLENMYDSIDKKSCTFSSSKKGALGDLFFRNPEFVVTARTLHKMFAPNVERYVFEVPQLDNAQH